MKGAWSIYVCTGCGGATGRHNACDAIREQTPVVPCDDAAVERAARALAAKDGYPNWEKYLDDEDREWYVVAATNAFSAAGEICTAREATT
jgi:hypothetical protein